MLIAGVYEPTATVMWAAVYNLGDRCTGRTISRSQANFENQRWGTVDVGSYRPNPFGLHDMHGNVWEWVEDCWNETYDGAPSDGSAWAAGNCRERVIRGGDWNFPVSSARSASRGAIIADDRGLGGGSVSRGGSSP